MVTCILHDSVSIAGARASCSTLSVDLRMLPIDTLLSEEEKSVFIGENEAVSV